MSNIVVIGSSSAIGKAIIESLLEDNNTYIYLYGRKILKFKITTYNTFNWTSRKRTLILNLYQKLLMVLFTYREQ
jgi:NADP-dependent 3-hydroxy acid dehydrogenase YdfG